MGEKRKKGPQKRVSIIGFCADSRDWVPYEDADMECWTLNRSYIFHQRSDRHFDMHSPAIYANQNRRPGDHVGWLKQFSGPVYMHRADPQIPNSVTYPLADVAQEIAGNIYRVNKQGEIKSAVDEPYLTSSIAQEIALAIQQGYDEIHLYGIDLNTESEYAWQKPGVEYMLGVAAGKGIKVVLPDNCPLLKGKIYGRGYLSPEGERMSYEQLETRAKSLQHEQAQVTAELQKTIGARKELSFIMDQLVPGLDHEQLDQRRQQMSQVIGQLEQRLLQIQGSIKETAYWIHQTMSGQDPKEAVEQVKANGHKPDADGPVSELALMQYPEQVEYQSRRQKCQPQDTSRAHGCGPRAASPAGRPSATILT